MAKAKPTWADYKDDFDLEAISQAVWTPGREGAAIPRYTDDEFENIKEMVWSAAEKWVPRDIAELVVTGVEEKETMWYGTNAPTDEVKGFLDVKGVLRGTMSPFGEFAGQTLIVDWKTRDGELSQEWKERLIDSWQWRIYAAMTGAKVINYRGISRNCDAFLGCDTRDILIAVPDSNSAEVFEYLEGMTAQRNALIQIGATVWPRHQRDACYKYRRECEYKLDCEMYTMPKYVPEVGKVLSYTELDRFARCPEYSRRKLREDPGKDEDEATNIGSGFHRAMAALYLQLKEIQNNGSQ